MNPAFSLPNLMAREYTELIHPNNLSYCIVRDGYVLPATRRVRIFCPKEQPRVPQLKLDPLSLVKILYDQIGSQPNPEAGVEVEMYGWSKYNTHSHPWCLDHIYFLASVSKVTLDTICDTAFGYHADSVHDPHNELALAYHELISLQSGGVSCPIIHT
jgi:hypothetical protein